MRERKKSKPRVRMEGHIHALHGLLHQRSNIVKRHYRMSKDVFMKILHGVR
jgi:hypothetical protein